jgi:hypothetical protein
MFGEGAPLSAKDRQIALSDPRAKRDAYLLGQAQAHEMRNTGVAPAMPDYVTDPSANGASFKVTGEGANAALGPRKEPEGARVANKPAGGGARALIIDHHPEAAGKEMNRPWSGDEEPAQEMVAAAPPPAPAPAPVQAAPAPGYDWKALAARARNVMPSDPKAKDNVFGSPMRDANLSMAPSSYEYKPQYTPPDQRPGEKNVGPMANKMDADPIARTAIVRDPNTGLLAIDKTKGLKLVMGGLADLQRQVDQLEGARR